jgi:CheY-like chemotaxis protein
VEDNPVNQLVGSSMLNDLGCQVTVADDGVAGCTLFEQGLFDIVLMDCHMPKLNGYDATARIRAHETRVGWPRTPIVAVTANALHGDREKCLAAGMDQYLSKPFTRQQLRRILETFAVAPARAPGSPTVQRGLKPWVARQR